MRLLAIRLLAVICVGLQGLYSAAGGNGPPVFPADPEAVELRRRLLAAIVDGTEGDVPLPNIVFILADDLGYADTGVYGSRQIPTPHIDRLASDGVLFTSAYVTAASCSPSRAGLLTGRYQQRFGFEYNTAGGKITHRECRGLDPAAITLAEVLQKAGYATGMFGKWHLGTRRHLHPLSRGFDEFYGFLAGAHSFYPAKRKEPVYSTVMRGHTPLIEPEYLTDAIARETVKFIRVNKDRPFFAYVPFNAVHTPIQSPDEYVDRFRSVRGRTRRVYCAMTSALDDAVGTIVDSLDRHGLNENTLVVFLNDNGGPNYNSYRSNAPLRLGKLTLFEGGVRVPMIIKWPGRIAPRSVYERMVSSLDVFPTLCAAAGIELPEQIELDGVDLAPFLQGKNPEAPHRKLFWSNGPNIAVRKGKWKLIKSHDQTWLYDLEKDVAEKLNLADEYPGVVEELEKDHEEWRRRMKRPAWPGKPGRRKIMIDGKPYTQRI
jgi:arylsulfatase A-like enzyme